MTVHTRNIHLLAIEMYKVKNNISPNFISEIFPNSDNSCNLRNSKDFNNTKESAVFWGNETIRNIGPKIWGLM